MNTLQAPLSQEIAQLSQEIKVLWTSVYVASVAAGEALEAEHQADCAIREYQRRFHPQTGTEVRK